MVFVDYDNVGRRFWIREHPYITSDTICEGHPASFMHSPYLVLLKPSHLHITMLITPHLLLPLNSVIYWFLPPNHSHTMQRVWEGESSPALPKIWLGTMWTDRHFLSRTRCLWRRSTTWIPWWFDVKYLTPDKTSEIDQSNSLILHLNWSNAITSLKPWPDIPLMICIFGVFGIITLLYFLVFLD